MNIIEKEIVSNALIAEFTALTNRVGLRITHQHQLIIANWIITGTIIGVAFKLEAKQSILTNIVLILPFISSVFGFIWLDHEHRKIEIWNYIGFDLASSLSNIARYPLFRWRTYILLEKEDRPKPIFGEPIKILKIKINPRQACYEFGTFTCFIIPTILSIIVYFGPIERKCWNLSVLILGIVIAVIFIWQYFEIRKKTKKKRWRLNKQYAEASNINKVIDEINQISKANQTNAADAKSHAAD